MSALSEVRLPHRHYGDRHYGNDMVVTSAAKTEDTQATPAAHSVDLRKTYGTGQATVHALAGVTVMFERGQFTAVMGPSGSGG